MRARATHEAAWEGFVFTDFLRSLVACARGEEEGGERERECAQGEGEGEGRENGHEEIECKKGR